MNYQFSSTLLSAPRTLVVGIFLLLSSSTAMATQDPIPGIDIIVRKGRIDIITTSDTNGRFALRVMEPGQYTVSTDCRRLKVCPPYKILITATGTILKPSAKGPMTYDFTVENRKPVLLAGLTYKNSDKAFFDSFNYEESTNTEFQNEEFDNASFDEE